MKKILVTGGGGYVGNVLCRLLLYEGYEVRCMDNFHKGQCDALIALASGPNFEFMDGDVTNVTDVKNATKDIDGVVHLAAIVGFPACLKQPSLATAVNVDGTYNVLEHRKSDIPFIFASTGSVYGKVDGLCTEESPLNPVSLYGDTKKAADMVVKSEPNSVCYRFAAGVGVSPCMRVNLLVNDLTHQAVTNGCLNIFQADFKRTFIHVRDMADSFLFALRNYDLMQSQKVYNMGSNDLNWTKRELAEYISKQTGAFVSYAETGEDLDKRDYAVDYSSIERMGFKCRTSMEEGIHELIHVTPLLQIRHQYL